MKGTITKKHFLVIAKEFGWRKAVKVLLSKNTTALTLLVEGA